MKLVHLTDSKLECYLFKLDLLKAVGNSIPQVAWRGIAAPPLGALGTCTERSRWRSLRREVLGIGHNSALAHDGS